MGEIRACEVNASGRITKEGIVVSGGFTHFLLDVGLEKPIHCVCATEKAALNTQKYLGPQDEVSVEGSLRWINFQNSGPTLIVFARFVSYGTKIRPFQPLSWGE